jgi:HrpA-like RNA helicase
LLVSRAERSARARFNQVCRYFFDAPLVRVPGRTFPVDVRHVAQACSSAGLVESALELVLRIHLERVAADAPHEAILVFCTGQDEIATAAHALRSLASDVCRAEEGAAALVVLPLHASLPDDEQVCRARAPPLGFRRLR